MFLVLWVDLSDTLSIFCLSNKFKNIERIHLTLLSEMCFGPCFGLI